MNKGNFDYGGRKGYVEANGYVMIEAEYYSENRPGSDGSKWYRVHDRGPRGDAMKVSDGLPELGTDTDSGARLIYNVYFEKAGKCWLTYYRVFSLSEGTNNGVKNACRTRLAVNGKNYGDLLKGSSTAREGNWYKSIHTSNEPLSMEIQVNQGWNTIEVVRSSPSVAFDSILMVPYGELGQQELSVSGPEVSPNNIMTAEEYEAYRHGVAELPAEITGYKAGPTLNVSYGETKSFTVAGLTAAASTEPSVAEVKTVSNGSIEIIGHHAGTVKLNATINGEAVTMFVKVGENPNAGKGVYQEADGLLVINALDAPANTDFAKVTGSNDKYNWSKSGFGLQVLPDDGGKWTAANGPALAFVVNITNAGDYWLRLHSSSPNGSADDYHLVVDGGTPITKWTGTGSIWNYLNDDWAKVSLTAGQHVVQLFAGEDGLTINQLVLSKNKNDSFTGLLTPSETAAAQKQIQLKDFIDLERAAGKSLNVGVHASVLYGEADDTASIAVTSDDEDVVTATYKTDTKQIALNFVKEGTATITVTASFNGCTPVSKTFTVKVISAEEATKVYQPNSDGNIIINAADAKDNKPYATLQDGSSDGADYHWVAVTEGSYTSMQVQKVGDTPTSLKDGVTTGTPWNETNTWTSASQMTYKVSVPETGKYYLSVYSYSWNDKSNSFHLILNGQHQFRAGKDTGKFTNEKDQYGSIAGDEWFYGKVQLDLKQGENTITIAGRKSGYVLRQIMLSPQQQTTLNGWQTACAAAAPETEEAKLYLPKSDGTIVINAADALDDSSYADHTSAKGVNRGSTDKTFVWKEVDDSQNTGKKAVQLQAENDQPTNLTTGVTMGTWWVEADTSASAPKLNYKVYVPEAGSYYLSFNAYGYNADSNSCHMQLNDEHQFRPGKDDVVSNGDGDHGLTGDEWFYGTKVLNLKEGENTITIAGRKSGFVLRQIMLSPEQQSNPSGWIDPSNVGAWDEMDIYALRKSKKAKLPEIEPDETPEIKLAGMDDVEMTVGGTGTVQLELTGDTDISYIVEAISSEEKTVSVTTSEEGITLTGIGAGEAEITVTILAEDKETVLAERTFTVTVAEAREPEPNNELPEQANYPARENTERLPAESGEDEA